MIPRKPPLHYGDSAKYPLVSFQSGDALRVLMEEETVTARAGALPSFLKAITGKHMPVDDFCDAARIMALQKQPTAWEHFTDPTIPWI
jgi:hypothetical protein